MGRDPAPPPPVITFVIPVRNDANALERCLLSIARDNSGVSSDVVVADNGSTDGSAETARAAGAAVESLPNMPVAEVRNRAAAVAHGELLAFVDADHEIAGGWTRSAVQLMQDPGIAAVGAEYMAPADATWVQRIYDRFRAHRPGVTPAEWLPSGNLVVRRSVFRDVGGFDPGLESCEDVDLSYRIRAAGGRLLSASALQSVHHGDPRTLRALFLAELWRGRDNIRVSLRQPLTLRTVPSVAIPVVDLGACTMALLGFGTVASGGFWLALSSVSVVAVFAMLRAVQLFARTPRNQRSLGEALRIFLVAATYDVARAAALVLRAGHRVRRKG